VGESDRSEGGVESVGWRGGPPVEGFPEGEEEVSSTGV